MTREIACILAGGRSSRMGHDKAEASLLGKRLIDHVVERIRPQVDMILLSAPHDYGTGLRTVQDREASFGGPVLGVLSLVDWLILQPFPCDYVALVSVDLPLLPSDLVARFREQIGSSYAFDGKRAHPTCAYLSVRDLVAWHGQVHCRLPSSAKGPALMNLLEELGARPCLFAEASWLRSVNTEAELRELETQTAQAHHR